MEGESADVVETAVYRRNSAVEERFNCEIVLLGDAFYAETANRINKDITSGDDLIDLVAHHVVSLGLLVGSDLFMNWYDIPNVNFDKPWWSDSNKELLTHNGVCLMAIGDLSLSAMYQTYATFYNKRLGADYDMPDLFEVVNNGEWTIDTIISYSKDIYMDLNMDGKADEESDLFGYASDYSSRYTYIMSFDNPIYRVNNGSLELTLRSDKLSSIYAKLIDEFSIYRGVQTVYKNGAGMKPIDIFAEGRAMFINATIDAALALRDMEDDYSILPMPKWDEAQEKYITMSDGNHNALAIPVTVQNLEAVGTITEALCAESYKIVFPAYYDVALKVKGTRDAESIKMLDMIVESSAFDFGYIYDGWKGFAVMLYSQLTSNNKNIESAYKRYERSSLKWYNSLLEVFENYEG